jgi:hypothetical protein
MIPASPPKTLPQAISYSGATLAAILSLPASAVVFVQFSKFQMGRLTVIRMPRIQGFPSPFPGAAVMHSKAKACSMILQVTECC